MKKIRSLLAIIALVVTLSGPFFFQASGSVASATAHHAGSAVAVHFYKPPCPVPSYDC